MSDADKYPSRTQVGGTEKSDVDLVSPLSTKHIVTGFTACQNYAKTIVVGMQVTYGVWNSNNPGQIDDP